MRDDGKCRLGVCTCVCDSGGEAEVQIYVGVRGQQFVEALFARIDSFGESVVPGEMSW